jgi:hypothetical protein
MMRSEMDWTLSLLKPEELQPAWRYIDTLERLGALDPAEAALWRDGLFERMVAWGIEPEVRTRPGSPPAEPREPEKPERRRTLDLE